MPPKNDQIDNTDIYKILNKIYKLQDGQHGAEQEEISVLKTQLGQMNILLEKLIASASTNINVAKDQKPIPYSKSSTITTVQSTKPSNPDSYTEIVNVYAENSSRPVQHMTIINDGPGNIYFIAAYANIDISTQETLLNVNDQRELFNVYEIRLRVTMPLTSYRLVEGTLHTGSFSPFTKANVKIQPEVQANEMLVELDALFDDTVSTITITSPTTQTLTPNYILSSFQPPLLPGATATLVDNTTTLSMPYTIPEGFIAEFFAIWGNLSTDNTVRFYIELIPGEFTLFTTLPSSNRGVPFNLILNVSMFTTLIVDPTGAPAGGRRVLATITNDDPFNNMTGDYAIDIILRRLS